MGYLECHESDVLRVDIGLDEDLAEALVICSSEHPHLSLAGLTRQLFVQEALRIAGAATDVWHT